MPTGAQARSGWATSWSTSAAGGICECHKALKDIRIENDRIVEVTLNGAEKHTF